MRKKQALARGYTIDLMVSFGIHIGSSGGRTPLRGRRHHRGSVMLGKSTRDCATADEPPLSHLHNMVLER